MYTAYLILVTAFCGLLIYSLMGSVRLMSPARLPASEAVLTLRECVERAQGLFTQLESEREGFLRGGTARDVDRRWVTFRVKWLKDLRDAEARCAPAGSRSRPTLRALYDRLERLQDLYATHATQFSSALGPEVELFRAQVSELRSDPNFGRLP